MTVTTFRVTKTEVAVVDVKANTAEEAKMFAWMHTNSARPVSLSVTLEAQALGGEVQ